MDWFNDPVNFIAGLLGGLLEGWGVAPDVVQILLLAVGAALLATIPLIVTIFLIWTERKLLGRVQDRLGPNRVGPYGIFQTFADMVKIFTKEYVTPANADKVPYNLAPVMVVGAVLMLWAVIPFTSTVYGVDLNVGVLYLVAVGAISSLGIIFAGWGSNNKYALLGGFRAVAMMLSYEVPMVVSLLVPVMLTGSMSMQQIVGAQEIPYIIVAPAAALIFFIASIAEVGRSPFDLLEADSELVSGFNIEYSGLKFGFFYVGDFLHGFTTALLFTTLFLGGWRGPGVAMFPILGVLWFVLKSSLVFFLSVLIRGSMPRFRIDHVLALNWKVFTPLSLAVVAFTAIVDKVVTSSTGVVWVRAAALLVVNVVLLVATERLMKVFTSRNPRPVVAPDTRPVARPEQSSS
jgi:NADH-quinone oxidoreductase subunit H